MLPGIAEPIIVGETNPIRFEKFCSALITSVEHINLVPTSTTYDRGRDARSIGQSKGSHGAVLCASLNTDIDSKVESDLKRLSSTSKPDRVIYCASQKLTEHRIDQITAIIRNHIEPQCALTVLGAIQLGNLGEKHPDILTRFYPGEIGSIEEAFLSPKQESAETRGLRLALFAFGSADARTLRTQISSRAILDVLSHLGPSRPSDICSKLSSDLGLPKPISTSYVEEVLAGMETAGLVCEDLSAWTLRPRC